MLKNICLSCGPAWNKWCLEPGNSIPYNITKQAVDILGLIWHDLLITSIQNMNVEPPEISNNDVGTHDSHTGASLYSALWGTHSTFMAKMFQLHNTFAILCADSLIQINSSGSYSILHQFYEAHQRSSRWRWRIMYVRFSRGLPKNKCPCLSSIFASAESKYNYLIMGSIVIKVVLYQTSKCARMLNG